MYVKEQGEGQNIVHLFRGFSFLTNRQFRLACLYGVPGLLLIPSSDP